MPTSHTSQYRSLVTTAYVTIGLLGLGMLVNAVGLVAEAVRYGVLGELNRGIDVGVAEIQRADDFAFLTTLLQVVGFAAMAFAFVFWFTRACRNVERLGVRDPRYGTGWAIGGWFVPIMSFFRPKQVANDIWRAGDSELGPDADGWRDRPVSQLLRWWWGSWIVAALLANAWGGFYGEPQTVGAQLTASAATIVADIAFIVAGALAIAVVYLASARQEERSWTLERSDEDVDDVPADPSALQVA